MIKERSNLTYYLGKRVKIGKNVQIWHFAYIGDDAQIGDNVSIGSLSHIDYKTVIGDNSRIAGQVYIPPLSVIGKKVFIGPAAVLTNDKYPMSKRMEGVEIRDGAVIGARSVVGSGLTIGENSVICMGAVVTKDVPPETVMMGHPAKPVYSRKEYNQKKSRWEKE